MSVWHDPGVQVARELNRLGVRHRETARRFARGGRIGMATLQQRIASDLFEAAGNRLIAARHARCRRTLDTMIYIGTFGLFTMTAILFFALPLLIAILFDHWIPIR